MGCPVREYMIAPGDWNTKLEIFSIHHIYSMCVCRINITTHEGKEIIIASNSFYGSTSTIQGSASSCLCGMSAISEEYLYATSGIFFKDFKPKCCKF